MSSQLFAKIKIMTNESDIFNTILKIASGQFKLDINAFHGVSHWNRVQKIGRFLARETQVDTLVLDLFSILHDSQRLNEYEDPEHGLRASQCAVELYGEGLLTITDEQLEQLVFACRCHNDRHAKSDDITIQTCWDADRLDLYRLGEVPDDKFLYTEGAKKRETKDFVLKLLEK